jgi:acylglycerol kinase
MALIISEKNICKFLNSFIKFDLIFSHVFRINDFMRQICLEAKQYGDQRAPVTAKLRKVLVVLNPAANKRSCEENYESYCAPIFNISGLEVEVVKTQSELHAIRYIEEELGEYPDALVSKFI